MSSTSRTGTRCSSGRPRRKASCRGGRPSSHPRHGCRGRRERRSSSSSSSVKVTGTSSRRFGLVQATALNMINMIGIGPFITIPLLMTALGGPQAMLGWIVALVIVICDGMVWSELGAAMPGSGGSFVYLREAFGRETLRPADGVSVRLAVHPERPARDRVGLHRLLAVSRLHLAGPVGAGPACSSRPPSACSTSRCSTGGSRRSPRSRSASGSAR